MDTYIAGTLKKKESRFRIWRLLHAGLTTLTLILVMVGLGVALLLVVPEAGVFFFAYLLTAWGVTLAAAGTLFRLAARRLDAEQMALFLERRHPHLDGELASAVQLGGHRDRLVADYGLSGPMIDALGRRIAGRAREILSLPVVDRRIVRRTLVAFLVVLMATGGGWMLRSEGYQRVLSLLVDPFRYYPFGAGLMRVTPGDTRILEGDTVEIAVMLASRPQDAIFLETRSPRDRAALERVTMEEAAAGTYRHRLAGLAEDLEYRVLHRRSASPWYTVHVSAIPRAGEVLLTLVAPSYAGMADETVHSGSMKCLKGTSVVWQAVANKPLSRAVLEMGNGEKHALSITAGTRLKSEFVVTAGGPYAVQLTDTDGFAAPRPDRYDITIIADEYPLVDLLAPKDDLELDHAAVVEVQFAARDDFGLLGTALVWRLEDGKTGRIKLADAGGRRFFQHGYDWDLGGLGLEPGATVTVQVEAQDNDSVSGPKAGVSPSRLIRIKDTRKVRQELAEMEKALIDDFVDRLGDELEMTDALEALEKKKEKGSEAMQEALEKMSATHREADRKYGSAMEKFDQLLRKMADDPATDPSSLFMKVLAREMLENVYQQDLGEGKQLDELARAPEMTPDEKSAEAGWMGKEKEKRVSRMEQAINMMKEAGKYARMDDLLKNEESLVSRQMDLIQKLDAMKGAMQPADAKEINKILHDIVQKLNDLVAGLTSMSEELPEDFVNADAMKDMPLDDIGAELKEMAEALAKGDIKKARELAEQLLKKLTEMQERLQEAARKLREGNRQAMENFRQKGMTELGRLVQEQRETLTRSEALAGTVRKRLDQRLAEELARPVSTPPTLTEKDVVTPGEEGELKALAAKEKELRGRSSALSEKIAAMAKALMMIPPEMAGNLEEAATFMGEAGQQLGGNLPGLALAPEREALNRLQKAQENGNQAMQAMDKMNSLQQGGRGAMMEAGQIFGMQLRSSPQRGQREGGKMGASVRNFRIPGSQEFEVPRVFREEVMESMKAGYPAEFERAIREYFRSISE